MAVRQYKTKQGKRYQAELYVDGQRVGSKSGFETKKDAKEWLFEASKTWKASALKPTPTAFSALANDYLTEISDRRKRNTYVYKRGTFRRVLAFLGGDISVDDVTRETLISYLATQKDDRGPKAANCDLRELSTLFNWAMRHGRMQTNPARPIESYAEESYVRYVPPSEDIAAVRIAATAEERAIIDTLYYTAARLTEILTMTWEDVNFEARAVRLWTSKRRGGNREPRVIGMHQELYKVLWSLWESRDRASQYVFTNSLTGDKYHRGSGFVRDLFKRVCERAGLEKPFTAHCIRHHVASRLSDSRKATHRQIQQFLGHMNLRTTETYLHELQVDHDILNAFDLQDSAEQPRAKNDT